MSAANRARDLKTIEPVCSNANCPRLGVPFVALGRARKAALQGKPTYCSKTCGKESWLAKITATSTGRRHSPETKAKQSAAKVAQYADPTERAKQAERAKRSGNRPPLEHSYVGGAPTPCEALLLDALPAGWLLHHRIARDARRDAANLIEIDLALLSARVAVEVDGNSHRYTAQKVRDRAKEEFYLSRGFRVIRIPNESAENDLEACVVFIAAVAARPAAEQVARPW